MHRITLAIFLLLALSSIISCKAINVRTLAEDVMPSPTLSLPSDGNNPVDSQSQDQNADGNQDMPPPPPSPPSDGNHPIDPQSQGQNDVSSNDQNGYNHHDEHHKDGHQGQFEHHESNGHQHSDDHEGSFAHQDSSRQMFDSTNQSSLSHSIFVTILLWLGAALVLLALIVYAKYGVTGFNNAYYTIKNKCSAKPRMVEMSQRGYSIQYNEEIRDLENN